MQPQKSFVKNAADEGQVREAEKKVRLVRDRELNDIRHILSSPQGRRFLWRYLSACGVYKISFDHSGSITSFNEGMRNIGLKLLSDVTDASPEAYIEMMKESKEGELNNV
jgi:hypothetical protein